jgi:hypothetical protein
MTLDRILNGLNWLAYEAEKQGHTQKEKILYAATVVLMAGQNMRDNVFDMTKEWKLDEAVKAWDEATKREEV